VSVTVVNEHPDQVSAAEIEMVLVDQVRDTRFEDQQASEARALAAPIWEVLLVLEKERILKLLVERIEYDGRTLAVRVRVPALVGEVRKAS